MNEQIIPTETTEPVSVRMPTELKVVIKKLAHRHEVSMNQMFLALVQSGLQVPTPPIFSTFDSLSAARAKLDQRLLTLTTQAIER